MTLVILIMKIRTRLAGAPEPAKCREPKESESWMPNGKETLLLRPKEVSKAMMPRLLGKPIGQKTSREQNEAIRMIGNYYEYK